MSTVFDILTCIFVAGGVFFLVLGGFGLLRLKDFYARTHPASMIDTMGAGMILIGLCFQSGSWIVTVKLLLTFLLIMISSPTAAHALVKAAYADGVRVDASAKRIDARGSAAREGGPDAD